MIPGIGEEKVEGVTLDLFCFQISKLLAVLFFSKEVKPSGSSDCGV